MVCAAACALTGAKGQPGSAGFDPWAGGGAPFSFRYGGRLSADLLAHWQRSERIEGEGADAARTIDFTDPDTHLTIEARVRPWGNFGAIDWVLYLRNDGSADTPIIDTLLPLDWNAPVAGRPAVLHSVKGSNAAVTDFAPITSRLEPGRTLLLGTASGRSSDDDHAPAGNRGSFPFFDLQLGSAGYFGAVGWTGSWRAHFRLARDGASIRLDAGMARTHLRLHPGESIRTPRILLMPWNGSVEAAQNRWRQLMIAHYSPHAADHALPVMPACWDTWGTEREAVKLDVIRRIGEQDIRPDLYWIDAGWYEPISLAPDAGYNVDSAWAEHRGDWVVSRNLYPEGMGAIGSALRAEGIGFLLWFEAETANAGAHNLRLHPDWYFMPPGGLVTDGTPAFLNLGNPAALRWITDLVSRSITDYGLTWYRQDFNFEPAPYWAAADAPDRVGMSEIRSVTGLYAYWDALLARHPGLRIDNCASGGRRLDIETMARSVPLWRSDNDGDPIGQQFHTLGLMPWIPLTAGVWMTIKGQPPAPRTEEQLYEQRSGYCAAMTVGTDQDPAPWLKSAFDEFREVRPYFLGDYHRLSPVSARRDGWAAWQLDRGGGRAGVVIALRRPACAEESFPLALAGLDPQATYHVAVRTGFNRAPEREMSGADLSRYVLAIPHRPGSAVLFYWR